VNAFRPSPNPFAPVRFLWIAMAAPVMFGCARSSEKAPLATISREAGIAASPSASTPPRHRSLADRLARLDVATNTRDLLDSLADDCLSCAEEIGCLDDRQSSGVCETVPRRTDAGPSEVARCLDTLRCIFRSKCANPGHQALCVCGSIDPVACMTGQVPAQGTCIDLYRQNFSKDIKVIYRELINPEYGAGRANEVAQCVTQLCPTCRIP
jgi:hypothetical protein